MLFILLGLGLFLIGAMAFAVDMSNLWFNRQAAQTAADAACTAGAMDMLVDYTNGTTNQGGFSVSGTPTAADCSNSTNQATPPCRYATLNGFDSSISQGSANSGALGNNVTFQVSTTAPPGLPASAIPPTTVAANAFLSVKVTDNIPTFFAGMLRGTTKQNIGATAICGVIQATSPIPILVLNPTIPGALHMNGGGALSSANGDIQIAGGPPKSIQVNSDGTGGGGGKPVSLSGNPSINLCAGGNSYCGSSLGVWGTQSSPAGFWSTTSKCTGVNTLCTGTQTAPIWNSPSAPIADPFASISAPSQPTITYTLTNGTFPIAYNTKGCPDPSGCHEFSPGYYQNGIDVQGFTAIFDPGIYYIGAVNVCNNAGAKGALCERSGSCMRPSNQVGDGSGGVIFYFAGAQSVNVGGGGGSCTGVNSFNTATGAQGLGVKCTSSTIVPGNIPGMLTGSVLLAPCQKPTVNALCASANSNANCNLNFGDPLGINDPNGEQRGILFFQNRAMDAGNNPSWSGNGSMLLAGTMYFHQCVTSGSDTGQGCVSGAYDDLLSLGGTPSSSTYVLGDVIVDKLSLSGNAGLTMDLNPSAAYTTLKASLLQ
jgi:hypothetical protein